ncbi:MAG: response regulator [Verrucomicrobia bacterium]|nr:response regulator [Verrucomicrobiota bacterium]
MTSSGTILILADDDPDDRLLTREAFEEAGYQGDFRFVEDGRQLLEYLDLSRKSLPGVILLDLNMPRMSGFEALRELKADPALRSIPIIVLTTSNADEDVLRSYDLGGNSFITKPASFAELTGVAKRVISYWLETVKLPPQH